MNAKKVFLWIPRSILLILLYVALWILGSMAVTDHIPDTPSEPGLVDEFAGILILSVINLLLIVSLIVTSRYYGWRLALALGVAYYGSFTLMTQVESWYFLSEITVSAELLPRLLLMGVPIPFLFIPLAVLITSRWKAKSTTDAKPKGVMPAKQLGLKLAIIAVIYLLIYWLAGYYIAWQNPELRAFYGSPGEIVPFWQHTANTFRESADLFLLQLVRGILFALIAMPVIRGSKVGPWLTALLVALLLSIPHLVHILANPLMPLASVRFSHMIETASSTFIFGLVIVWLLYRRHYGVKDIFR